MKKLNNYTVTSRAHKNGWLEVTVQFRPDCGLLLELHAPTLATPVLMCSCVTLIHFDPSTRHAISFDFDAKLELYILALCTCIHSKFFMQSLTSKHLDYPVESRSDSPSSSSCRRYSLARRSLFSGAVSSSPSTSEPTSINLLRRGFPFTELQAENRKVY